MKKGVKLAAVPDPRNVSADPGSAVPGHGATLEGILADGTLTARTDQGVLLACDCLEAVPWVAPLAVGDRVLVLVLPSPGRPVVVGRIGRHLQPSRACIQATEQVSIKCGESSIDMRADGKVLIRGDDVLVRAKGSKRIRAGTVSIN